MEKSPARRDSDPEQLLVQMKSPLMPAPAARRLGPEVTVREAVRAFLQPLASESREERRLREQLARETSGRYSVFVRTATGGMALVDDGDQRLGVFAFPVEIRDEKGLRKEPVVAIGVQSYAEVGAAACS